MTYNMYTVRCISYDLQYVHCMLYIIRPTICTLYAVYHMTYNMYTVCCISYDLPYVHCMLYIIWPTICKLYAVYHMTYNMYTVCCISYDLQYVHCMLYIIWTTICTLYAVYHIHPSSQPFQKTVCPFLHFAFPFTDTEQFYSPERPTVPLYLTFPLKTQITIVFSSARTVQHNKVRENWSFCVVKACGHSMKLNDQFRAPAAFPLVSPVLIW